MDYKENYNLWLEKADEATKAELLALSDEEIYDRFYRTLEFGTGGLRGILGAGTNRMNIYTVRQATQGLAKELADCGDEEMARGVVIAHDSRNMSREFALECTKVLAANGIKAYLFDELRPTPELSFAVRHLNAARGIVITASHNPKEYNGYKAYGEDGGQLSPEPAKKILEYINQIDIFEGVKLAEPDYIEIGADVDAKYLEAVKAQSLDVDVPEDFKLVYTPLHGSGNKLVRKILDMVGIKNVVVVKEQELPDGNFPTVKSPNPENKEAFTIAIKLAEEVGADIAIGTDPDSDRVGVVVKSKTGEYITFNGNQTGVLLCDFILTKLKESGKLPANGSVIKTIVTTEMITEIAKDYGVNVDNVLTGFKFIGEKIKEYEDNGNYTFILGMEESYGYLSGTYARDKDAVVASMLVAQMAAEYAKMGKTLEDRLFELFEKYGYFREDLVTMELYGEEGSKKIAEMVDSYRNSDTAAFEYIEKIDYLESEKTGLPKANVIKYLLPGNGYAVVRPSGTEPKIKFYLSVCTDSKEATDKKIAELRASFLGKNA